jgi:hypothetical protein
MDVMNGDIGILQNLRWQHPYLGQKMILVKCYLKLVKTAYILGLQLEGLLAIYMIVFAAPVTTIKAIF